MFKIKEHISDNRGLLTSLVLVFAATLGSAVFLVYTLVSTNSFIHKGVRDVGTVTRAQFFMNDLQVAESNERGYIINGSDNYLERYRQAADKLPEDLKELASDPNFRERYKAQLDLVQKLSDQRIKQFEHAIDVRKNQGQEAALALRYDRGKATMDQINSSLQQIVNTELQSIGPQERTAEHNMTRSLILTPLLVAFVLAMCLMIMRYFQKGIDKERGVEGSKNEFLSLASHQLRTPATNVKQYLHLVLDGYFGKISREQREALVVADRNNDIEISIINDLLNIAKADLNQISIAPQQSAPSKLIKQVMKEYRDVVKRRRQKLVFTEASGVTEVSLDPTYFKTVLENLIDNASKYTPVGGKISLLSEVVGGYYLLRVKDDGVGIAKHDIPKLFKKFSRVPNPLSDTVEGSGLGLYWAKRVIELHGGTINVASRLDEGSEFTIKLPLERHS